MKTAEEINMHLINSIGEYNQFGISESDFINELADYINQAQQEAFNEGRDKALDWASEKGVKYSYEGLGQYSADIDKESILKGKQAPELQYNPAID